MRALILTLVLGLSAGSAQAQTLFPIDPLAEQRARIERDRAAADARSNQAVQFRYEGELSTRRLEATARNDVPVGAAALESADLRAEAARLDEVRRRTEEERARELERRLRDMGSR